MRITVKQGGIHVNSVQYLKRTKGGFVLSVDCRQKYPIVADCDGSGVICLGADERTLGREDAGGETEISLGLRGPWRICAVREGRYTICVYGVRSEDVPDEERQIWSDDE